jgi:acetylornithine/succinyldiaminopimelate/putrescine aminotransferase
MAKDIELKKMEPLLPGMEDISPRLALKEALVPDPLKHPERGNASLGRIEEVLDLILDDKGLCDEIINKCKSLMTHSADEYLRVNEDEGTRIAEMLYGELDELQVSTLTQYMYDSELSTDEVVELHRKFKIPVSHLEDDLLPVRGEGARIRDSKGRIMVDLDSNYSATNLGNSNKEIATGLYNQASYLISQKEDRIQVARSRFLLEIEQMMPSGLNRFYWQNSGGEAVDKSIKIAKAYTEQTGVIAFEGGFHGRTHGAVAITFNKKYRKPFGLDNEKWVHFAPFGKLEEVEKILSAGNAKIVMLELIQGEEAGIRPASQEFASGLRALCDAYDAVMIVDEVQTGFGRVAGGSGQWFASHRYNVVPDIITIGKSFGGGYPVTAVVTNEKISSKMMGGYDGSTFGGNPMAMTAALIATRQMRSLDLTARTVERSKQFEEGLEKIDSPLMKGFRAVGLMVAVDLDSAETVAKVQEKMKKHGAHSSLSTGATIRWMPPLVISPEEVEQVLYAFEEALKEIK